MSRNLTECRSELCGYLKSIVGRRKNKYKGLFDVGAYLFKNCKEIRATRVSEPQGQWKKMMLEKELEPANVVLQGQSTVTEFHSVGMGRH